MNPTLRKILLNPQKGLVKNGLVREFRFDDVGQVLTDHSVYGMHGQAGNSAGVDAQDPVSVSFGWEFGNDDYVDCGNDSSLNLDKFYIETVITIDPTSPTGYIFAKNSLGITDIQYGLYWSTVKNISAYINGQQVGATASNVALPGTPIHIGLLYDKANVSYFINNILLLRVAKTDTITSAAYDLVIGKRNPNNVFIKGIYHWLNLYNIDLTNTERTKNYNYLKQKLLSRGITL